MRKFYFTFGQSHTHRVNGFTYDCDVVVEIEAEKSNDARDMMQRNFELEWAFEYPDNPP